MVKFSIVIKCTRISMGEKKCKNLNDGYGRINREFFFFSFFSVVVVKTIRTRRSYSILSGTGKPGARLGQTELQRVMEVREREREWWVG